MTIQSIFSLHTDITNVTKWHFENQPDSVESRAFYKEYLERLNLDQLTPKGARRYPAKIEAELQRLTYSLRDTYTGLMCVFGYWYEEEFYTTYKNAGAGLKTTEILHNLEPRLTSKQWDTLESGLYYKDTLKKYY
tara:strand:+ start:97 stop:501 length:405 start_codon:yes stop_codon:yes gene_type:complete